MNFVFSFYVSIEKSPRRYDRETEHWQNYHTDWPKIHNAQFQLLEQQRKTLILRRIDCLLSDLLDGGYVMIGTTKWKELHGWCYCGVYMRFGRDRTLNIYTEIPFWQQQKHVNE